MQIEEKCYEDNLIAKNVSLAKEDLITSKLHKSIENIVKKESLAKEDLIPSKLDKSIENIVKKERFITHNVFKRMISTEGGNYLGVLYEIDVKGKTAYGDKELNIFVKNIISCENMKIFSVHEAYLKELYAYTELAKIFEELQNDADVPVEERFKIAKCYDESNSEAIMLENLARKGFTTGHRMDAVPLKFAELTIQQLAKFHGLSFVLQKHRPEYFNRKVRTLKQAFIFTEEWKSFSKNMIEMSTKNLNYNAKKKLEEYNSVFCDKFPKYMEDSSMIGACLCHGDFRPNNVLMKQIDGEISEVVPVDFQLLYYGCPLNDFLYFIFSGTDQKFRREHLTDLKNMYYETLAGFLKQFDMDLEIIYPRKEFEKQYTERLDYGLMVAMYLIPFCFAADDDIPDIGKDDMANMNFKLDSRFQERIQGIVDDFIEWGYL